MTNYDVIIIGSGPGGYISAIKCSELGLKTALIEKYDFYGGTCLNVGCIPTKYLLEASNQYYNAKYKFELNGIMFDNIDIDLKKMLLNKKSIIQKMSNGISFLFKKHKVNIYKGFGSFVNSTTIEINNNGIKHIISAKNIVIATGSKPRSLSQVTTDKTRIVTSTEALNINHIYKKIVIIGGGAIGLEFAYIYSALGSDVTIIEYEKNILPNMDDDMSYLVKNILIKKMRINFLCNYTIKDITNIGEYVKLNIINNDKNNNIINLTCDYCIIAIGRTPYIKSLKLENAGIKLNINNDFIPINNCYQTNIKNIYAIGDVVKGPMLAHKAENEGIAVAEIISNYDSNSRINYDIIPNIVYIYPEIAIIGETEKKLIQQRIKYKKSISHFYINGRSQTSNNVEGTIKILLDYKTNEILGTQIIGPSASEIITSVAIAMTFKASTDDIEYIVFPHPTYGEIFKEACKAYNHKS